MGDERKIVIRKVALNYFLILAKRSGALERVKGEVDGMGSVGDLDLNTESYSKLEELGVLEIVVAMDCEERLVGFFVAHCATSLHRKDLKMGISDVIYVEKEYRGTKVFHGLIKAMENLMKNKGCKWMEVRLKNRKKMRGFDGYRPVEISYQKRL
jgi:GNAT superfamily N-acetyltransferase